MSQLEFYLQRASECADNARCADLPNVKEIFLRSEEAWREMAQIAEVTERHRRRNLQTKEARLA